MELGTILNERYQIIRQIGSGGSSEVYLVKHIYLDSEFAVKVVMLDRQSQIDYASEAHVLKDLRHPQLPRIIDIFQDEQYLYIVRDYIAGIDLEQHVDRHGPQSLTQTIDYALQLIEVLNYLHTRERPLIYRDLKPSNIIKTDDNRLVLIDFGTTRTYNPERDEDTVYLGTKGYAPPELFGGIQSDQRTDIYSLGATLYYIYTAEHWSEVAQSEKFAKFNGTKAAALRTIIERAMRLTPEKRYQTMLELQQDLQDKGLSENKVVKRSSSERLPSSKVIVAVMGLTRGCGCTHQAIAIAKYCAKQIGKTVYLQKVANDSLTLLENYFSGHKISRTTARQSFKVEGVEFMREVSGDQLNTLLTQYNTNVVIDYATNFHLLNDFLKAHKKIIVLPKSAWALAQYPRIIELMKYQDVEFIVNLADDETCDELADWLDVDHRRLHAGMYQSNPFLQRENSKLYAKLIGETKKRRRFNLWGGSK